MTQISITRALVELKRYDQRIQSALNQSVFGVVAIGLNDKQKLTAVSGNVKFKDTTEATAAINGSIQSVRKLIDNRAAIKAAIVKSNAETMINFAGKKMSVAEAIELKTTVNHLVNYRNNVATHLTRARNEVISAEAKLDAAIQLQTQALLGGEAKKTSDAEALIETITKAQHATQKPSVVAEDLVSKTLEQLNAEIDAIEAELDFALSESNAKTSIEVEL